MSETIGFIGLGIMGGPMAAHLAKKHDVLGYDVDAGRAPTISGITPAATIGEVAEKCSVVFLSLPNSAIVEQVVLGDAGLAPALRRSSIVVDMSTTLPTVSVRLAEKLRERSIDFVDAPVSGGEAGAKEAALSIMVGASSELFERCRPYLETMGKSVVRVGEAGAGGVAKLANNMIVGATFSVIAESFALAARFGIPADLLFNAIRGGWAGSKVLEVSGPAMVEGDFRPGGTVNLLEKDIGYARTLAAELHVPIPVTAITHEVFVASQAAGNGPEAQPVIVQLWERLLGIEVATASPAPVAKTASGERA
jgi:2-hydroxy-3-oxopropionate reductase